MDPQPHIARRSRARKIGKLAGYTLGTIVVLPFALVTLVLLALKITPIRNFAVQKGVAYANESLGGYTVKVKSVDRIDPWGLNARGIQMFDDKQRELVNVPWVMARLKPWPLVHNTLRLTRVEIDGVRAHLYPADPNKPPEPEEPPSEPSTFTVRVEHARIRSAQLETDYDDRTIKAVVGTLSAGGVYGPKPALAIKEAQIRADADDELLLRLRTTEGAWTAEKGGKVGIEAQIVDAPLTLSAELPALDQMEPWPVKSAELALSNVTRRTLALLGVKDGADLHIPVGLTLAAKADGKRLNANVKLLAGKRKVINLDAYADDKAYDVSMAVVPTQLAAIAALLPNLKVQGNLHAHATPTSKPVPEKVDLSWKNVAVDDAAFPDGAIRSELALPVVRLKSVKLVGLEEEFALAGEYNIDTSRGSGVIDFQQLQLDAVELLKAQGLAGLLDGHIEAKLATTSINADGRLKVRDFKHPSAQLGSLDLALAVSGTLLAPVGHFNLALTKLAASDVKLDKLNIDALATPQTVSGKVEAIGPDTHMKTELGGQRTADGRLRLQGIGRGIIAKKELRFDLRELHYGGQQGLAVEELALFAGKQSVVVAGKLDKNNRIDASIALEKINLTEWAALANVSGLEGLLSGKAKIGGSTAEPSVDSNFNMTKVKYKSDLPVDGTIALKADLATRKAELNLGVYSSDDLGARINAQVSIPKRPAELSRALVNAQLKLTASVFMPVAQISAMAGDQLAGLEGMLEAHVTADGTLQQPNLDADVTAALKLPGQEGNPVEAFKLTAKVDKDQGKLSVWAKDGDGELLSLDGFLAWPGGNPRAALQQPTAWRETRFQLRAELTPRRLDTMQGVFAYFSKIYALDLPLSAGAKVTFEGEHGVLGGAAELHATVFGDKLDGRCKLGTTSGVDLDIQLKQDHVDAKVGVRTDGGGAITGTISSKLALNALSGEDPVFGPAEVTLEGSNIAIYKLPGLCNLATGSASFKADATGLGKQKPVLDLTAKVSNLSAPETEAIDVNAKVHAGGDAATLSAQLDSKSRHVGSIDAKLPLIYPDGINPNVAPDAAVDARVRFDKLLLANVLSFTEALGRIGGSASADIKVSGKLNEPYPEGYIQLADVNMSVASLAQPLREVNARLDIKGRSVKLEKLTARDRGGKLSVQGYANLAKDFSGDGGLYIEADRFPLRQQGTVIGELTTRARADVKIPKDLKATAELKILDGRIWLTGDRGKSVQNLDAHPDIRFADEKVGNADTEAEQAADGTTGSGFVLGLLTIKTENPLWLQHQDFSLQVGVDIKLTQNEDGPKLLGEATLVRGELQLLSKPFKLKNGAIRFTGDMPPDPELDIKATFKPPTGPDLMVAVTGRGSHPLLEFSGAATNAGEAVAVITGRGTASGASQSGAEQDASSQMAGIASNMTAGLLVMSARRNFGDWVPMISINTGASGQPNGASAGFDASKLIPPWAKGFAKSAYVEGLVGTQGQGGGNRFGVTLEVGLPRDFLTTLGYGTTGWSTDVSWSP